jgi:hypothetical protein
MTSPSHGGDPESESQRAHQFFFQSDAEMKAEADDDNNGELYNYREKLCNFRNESDGESLAGIMTDRYIDEKGEEQIEMLWEELIEEHGTDFDENDPHFLKAESRHRKAAKLEREKEFTQDKEGSTKLILRFTRDELKGYTAQRQEGLAKKSRD